jgi:hypothetical protein
MKYTGRNDIECDVGHFSHKQSAILKICTCYNLFWNLLVVSRKICSCAISMFHICIHYTSLFVCMHISTGGKCKLISWGSAYFLAQRPEMCGAPSDIVCRGHPWQSGETVRMLLVETQGDASHEGLHNQAAF